ncbi:MAG: diguanylate cyclase [Verrucomicrobiota bacterium]
MQRQLGAESQITVKRHEAELRARDLARQADTDALTGVLNRHGFNTMVSRELARARRHSQPLSLVLLDIDHFKQVNDRHGHAAGDQVVGVQARERFPRDDRQRDRPPLRALAIAHCQLALALARDHVLPAERNQLGDPDASGRRKPVAIPGSEFDAALDTLIVAISEQPETSIIHYRYKFDYRYNRMGKPGNDNAVSREYTLRIVKP